MPGGDALGEAARARANGIKIFSVGISQRPDAKFLEELSSEPQQKGVNWWMIDSYNSLSTDMGRFARTIAEGICAEKCVECPAGESNTNLIVQIATI